MRKVVSTELLESSPVPGQGLFTGPYGTGVVDLESESWAKFASLEVRPPDGGYGGVEARLEAREWDDQTWVTLGTLFAPMDHQSHYLHVELDPNKELVRYTLRFGAGTYIKLILSDEEGTDSE